MTSHAQAVELLRTALQEIQVHSAQPIVDSIATKALAATATIEAPTSEAMGELDTAMADANLSHIACMMSNAMYNLSQNPGRQLTVDDCEAFDNLRKQWDAARIAPPASPTVELVSDGKRDAMVEAIFKESGYTISPERVRAILATTGEKK